MNTQNQIDYKFLIEPLLGWLRTKCQYYFEVIEAPLQNIEDSRFLELGISKEEFKKTFLEPYERFNSRQLELISEIQTSLSHDIFKNFMVFNIRPFDSEYMNAIEWTLVNIKELHLKGLDLPYEDENDDFITHLYSYPHEQCIYCGKPDKDKRGKSFGVKKLKICHVKGCITNNSNTGIDYHKEGCCYLEWKRIKKNFETKLSNIKKSPVKRREKVIELFENFLEQRFDANLSTKWTIQTFAKKARKIIPIKHNEIDT